MIRVGKALFDKKIDSIWKTDQSNFYKFILLLYKQILFVIKKRFLIKEFEQLKDCNKWSFK